MGPAPAVSIISKDDVVVARARHKKIPLQFRSCTERKKRPGQQPNDEGLRSNAKRKRRTGN